MDNNLLRVLVEKKVVIRGTVMEVSYLGRHLDGRENIPSQDFFRVEGALIGKDKSVILEMACVRDNSCRNVKSNQILNIEGMPPERFAQVYNLKANGKDKPMKIDEFGNPVRRGRKPNIVKEQMRLRQAERDALEDNLEDDDNFDDDDDLD